jgi:dolichol-phosphate mannosyltransferase
VLTHPRNLGIPEAFFDGFSRVAGRAADDDVMFCVEGDNTSDPSLLPAMIAALEAEADIVVASRHAPGGCYLGFPLRRHFVSALGNATMRVLFPYPGLQDFSIFYRGVRCDLLKSVLRDHGRAAFRGRGFAANASFLLACLLYRPRVREVPHTYRYDNKKSRSTFPVLSTIRAYVELIGSTGVRRLRAACLTAAAENPHSSS